MKHFVSRCTWQSVLRVPCCLQVVLLNLLAASAPLRTKASAVLLKASMNRLPLRFNADSATNGANEAKIEAFQNLYPLDYGRPG